MIKVNRVLNGMFVCGNYKILFIFADLYGEKWEAFQLSQHLKCWQSIFEAKV